MFGRSKGWCPYFLVRRVVSACLGKRMGFRVKFDHLFHFVSNSSLC